VPASREANEAKVLVAIPLQSDLRRVPRSNSNCGIRPPEAPSLLLAKAAKRHTRTDRPSHTIDRMEMELSLSSCHNGNLVI
jgi:hypothetical protein